MLDIECFTYLNRALENSISPIVILASNRGKCTVRGTEDLVAAHGIPPDLLARLLIVPTYQYELKEIRLIAKTRAKTEGVAITDPALEKIAQHGTSVSLRYALQLLTPAQIIAKVKGRTEIDEVDVEEAQDLFIDARRSAAVVRSGGEYIS
jgi:RuvB-like protein 1 (pontin 52)